MPNIVSLSRQEKYGGSPISVGNVGVVRNRGRDTALECLSVTNQITGSSMTDTVVVPPPPVRSIHNTDATHRQTDYRHDLLRTALKS